MSFVVSVSEQANMSNPNQLLDVVGVPSYKWFSLQNNVLDGSFHPTIVSDVEIYSIATQSNSFEDCSGSIAGNPNESNGQNVISIGPGWNVAMHYSPTDEYIKVNTDGGRFGTHRVTMYDDGSGTWKGCFGNQTAFDFASYPGKWFRVSVYARTNVDGSAGCYLLYNSSNPMTTFAQISTKANEWNRIEATIQVPTTGMTGTPVPYLYGQYSPGIIDWDGYCIEGPFDTDPGSLRTYETGWWGTTLSDSSGNFATAPTMTISDSAGATISMQGLTISGDSLLNEYPTAFTITFKNGTTTVQTINVTGNSNTVWSQQFANHIDAQQIEVAINSWSKSNSTVKVYHYFEYGHTIRSDTLRPKIVDSVSKIATKFITGDVLKPKIYDNHSLLQVGLNRTDSLKPKIVDVLTSFRANLIRTDSLKPKIVDIKTLLRNRLVGIQIGTKSYNIISAGDSSTSFSTQGFYDVTSGFPGTNLFSGGRSYNMVVYDRNTDSFTYSTYDIYGSATNAATMASDINALPTDGSKLVIVFGVDEPRNNRLTNGLDVAMYSLGASQAVFGGTSTYWYFRPAYILVGAPGLGEGKAYYEQYFGNEDSDPNAVTNVLLSTTHSDILKPKINDIHKLLQAQLNRTDQLKPKVDDIVTYMRNKFYTSDTLKPKIIDSSFFKQYAITRSDILKPKIYDRGVVGSFLYRNDILKPKINESIAITNRFAQSDMLIISKNVDNEVSLKMNLFDTVKVKLADTDTLYNIHTAMDADQRQVFGKMQIVYTDPKLDTSIIMTASDTLNYTSAAETANNVLAASYKWFSLQDNKLDGTYHPFDPSLETGWWSNTQSDASGNFATPVTLTATFNARPMYSLQVVSDVLDNNYPVNFTVTLYDINGNTLLSVPVTNNTLTNWTYPLSPIIENVTKMELSISSINMPNASARIVEFFTSVVENYDATRIEQISLLEEQQYEDSTLPVGNISSNELQVVFDNTDHHFDPDNIQSPLNALLKKNRKVTVWLGANTVPYNSSQIEWYQLGVFWTFDWNPQTEKGYATMIARDYLELMRLSNYTTSIVKQNATLYDLATDVLTDFGLTSSDYVLDTNLQNVTVPWAWFDRMYHRDALQMIAEAGLARVYCNRQGQVVMTVYTPPTYSIYTFSRDKSIIDSNRPLAWSQVYNYVTMNYSPMALQAASSIYSDSEQTLIPANSQVTLTHVFDLIPCTNVQTPTITADTGISILSSTIYCWGMVITYQNTSSTDGYLKTVDIQGQSLIQGSTKTVSASDSSSITENGQLTYQVTSNQLIQSASIAQNICQTLLTTYKDPRHDITIQARGNIALELGDRITAPDYYEQTFEDYFIIRQNIVWDGALSADIDGQKIEP